MEITEKLLLDKTHNGLLIYAYILRQNYKKNFELILSGRGCRPTKNPFRGHTVTLIIREEKGQFLHSDCKDPTFLGTPFDFATLHFEKNRQELLEILNKGMHLHIGEKRLFSRGIHPVKVVKEVRKPKIILPKFSLFHAPVTNTIPSKEVTILDVYNLIKHEYKTTTEELRKISNKKQAREFKAKNFDYVTFSGLFHNRSNNALRRHSGILAFDFDHLNNLADLKHWLITDHHFETEILFTSPSGDGLKWIINIDILTHPHRDCFLAVKNYLKDTYEVEVDSSGKDISRACFLPHDPQIYLNPKYH